MATKKKKIKCKYYKKEQGENKCTNFLGYTTIRVDDLVNRVEYDKVLIESCTNRCKIFKGE